MKHFKSGDIDSEKGAWQPFQQRDGTRSAIVSCPDCGALFTLSKHTIEADGTVHPGAVPGARTEDQCGAQLICPVCHAFHDDVRLLGWEASKS